MIHFIIALIACWLSFSFGFAFGLWFAADRYERAVKDEMIGAWEFGYAASRDSKDAPR